MPLSRKTTFGIVAALVVVAFLAGYIPQFFEILNLRSELRHSQERLQFAVLEGELALSIIEVQQNNFGNAQAHATNFFNLMRDLHPNLTDESLKSRVSTALERRDEVISDLATMRPEVYAKLREIQRQLYEQAQAKP